MLQVVILKVAGRAARPTTRTTVCRTVAEREALLGTWAPWLAAVEPVGRSVGRGKDTIQVDFGAAGRTKAMVPGQRLDVHS